MRRFGVSRQLLDEIVASGATLPDDIQHHLVSVLRAREKDRLVATDGAGSELTLEVVGLRPLEVRAIGTLRRVERVGGRIRVMQALIKSNPWELLLEKLTEVGVDEVVPVYTDRTVVEVPPAKLQARMQRWEKIIQQACQQSERAWYPELHVPLSFEDALRMPADRREYFGTPREHPAGEDLWKGHAALTFWSGPEGGLTSKEEDALMQRGATGISLGPYVLRAETAAITAAAIARYQKA